MTNISELVDYTLELGQPASCLTDHGVMYSIVDHFQYASKKGQKAIAGFEAYVVNDHKIKEKTEAQSETENKREHLVLLAKDNAGYKRLMKICSEGMTAGFYYRPRIDDNILLKYGTEGLIGTSACFLEDTDVLTKKGIKKITKIEINDEVLTHNNRLKPVISKTSRKYSGNIYTIKAFGGWPIKCTADHKFFILSKNDIDNYSKFDDSEFFIQNKKYIKKSQRIRKNSKKYNINWTEAQNLNDGDYLLTPINEDIDNISELKINSIFNEQAKKHIKDYTIKITKELLELLGIYCAEGSFIKYDVINNEAKHGITFTLAKKDLNIQSKVKKYMYNIFGLLPKIVDKKSGAFDFCYYSYEIAKAFNNWFIQGAENKKIPDFIKKLNPTLQMFFLKGLFLGDGHIKEYIEKRTNKEIVSFIFATISKQLVYDVISILHRNNINPGISLKPAYIKDNVNHRESYFLFLNGPIAKSIKIFLQYDTDYQIDINKLRGKDIPIEINGIKYMKYPVRNIKKEYMNTTVYCLNIQDDNSFLVNNVVVHNCIGGRVAQNIIKDRFEEAEKWAIHYYKLFNEEFYLEIQPMIDEAQVKVNKGLIEIHKRTGIPIVAATDFHYLKKEDA